jgi:hypothetical protein
MAVDILGGENRKRSQKAGTKGHKECIGKKHDVTSTMINEKEPEKLPPLPPRKL